MNDQIGCLNDEMSMKTSGSDQNNRIRDGISTDCYLELCPVDFHTKLIREISKTNTYINNMKYLPSVSLLAFLYIKTNITVSSRIAGGANSDGENADDYCYWINPESYESFVSKLLTQTKIEKGILNNFANILQNRKLDLLTKVQSLSILDLSTMHDAVKKVSQDFWNFKLRGTVDQYVLLANAVNHILILNASKNSEKIKDYAETIANYAIKTLDKGIVQLLEVDKPEDLTLIIDISFDNGQRKEKVTLLTVKGRREPDHLFSKKEMDFILSLVEHYTERDYHIEDTEGCYLKILPGTAMIMKQPETIPSKKPRLQQEDDFAVEISPTGMGLNNTIRMDRFKRKHKGDFTYIIGTRIRNYLAYPKGKFVIFSNKNNSIITNITIIVNTESKDKRFIRAK